MHIHDPYVSCIAESHKNFLPGVNRLKKMLSSWDVCSFFVLKTKVLESSKKLIDEVEKNVCVWHLQEMQLDPTMTKIDLFYLFEANFTEFFFEFSILMILARSAKREDFAPPNG